MKLIAAALLLLLAGALLRDRPKCHRWQFPGAGVCAERVVTA